MNNGKLFFASASGVILSLTAIVADGATPEAALAAAFAHAQDATVPPTTASTTASTSSAAAVSVAMQAKVIDVVGKVRWRANEQTAWKDARRAQVEDLLAAGAEVRTGLESRMTLKFVNATVLIDSNSNFAMPTVELVKDNDGDVYRTIAQMKSGRADFQVDKVGAKNDFKVVTPSSTLAVRGTGFSVSTGAMSGTEVTGARTNAIAAIQLKYAASAQTVELSGGGGEAKSSSELPEPATAALVNSIGAPPMAGTATSKAEVLASAVASTSQTPVQTQVTSTVAAVATVVAEIAAAASGEDGSASTNSVVALFADLRKVDGHVSDAVASTAAAGSRLQAAVVALGNAHNALTAAQNAGVAFRTAEAGAQDAASDVAILLSLVKGARNDTNTARLSALQNAQGAFVAFAPATPTGGGEADARVLANDALADASDARANANDALTGAGVAQIVRSAALNQLSLALSARASIQTAANAASGGASAAMTAAVDARAFRNLVEAARVEIARIFDRRPLSGIQESLTKAIDRLAVAEQARDDAEQARDDATTAAFSAQEEAQRAVLTAAQDAANQAATDALSALNAANQADQAAHDAQTGMAKLDLAITAMLQARDAESSAQGTLAAAEDFREIAEALGAQAQAQIDMHQGAEEIALDAAVDASVALLAALGHLDDAIINSGLTTTALGNCLAAINEGDLAGASDQAGLARISADATDANADDARDSADDAIDASAAATGAVAVSAGAQSNYAARLAELRAAVDGAIAQRNATQGFASAASDAVNTAATNGNSFAAQFAQTSEGASAANAAIAAVERALALGVAAQGYSESAGESVSRSQTALASVLDESGNEIDFGTTAVIANGVAADAAEADEAAIEARRLAIVADAEALTAETAVNAGGGLLNADAAATSVEFLHGQVTGLVAQIDDAIQVHGVALADAEATQVLAAQALVTVESESANADGQFALTLGQFGEMLVAMQSGNADGALAFAQSTDQLAFSVGTAANGALNASNELQLQLQNAKGFAADSQTQALRAGDALNDADGLRPLIDEQTQASEASAHNAESSAAVSQESASIANTEIAQLLADRALAFSVAALARAQDAIVARNAAFNQFATAGSSIEQAGFQSTGNIVNQMQSSVDQASELANAANAFALTAGLYSNLAATSSGAFMAGAQANGFRIDAESSRDGSIAQRDSAQSAITAHNTALGTVSSLFETAGVSLALAESKSLAAQDFANQANGFFLLATVAHEQEDASNVILNAGYSDGAATQSERSATASNTAANATRQSADLAAVQAGISNQAGVNYLNAVAAADQFASAAGDAHGGAVSAADQAQAYSTAAANFAAAIGSTQSASAADFATAARAQAITQRDGALAAQQSALMAANQARSMGERVFFTRTAEIAANTAGRADQARIFADLALSAATQARADATSAQALVGGDDQPGNSN